MSESGASSPSAYEPAAEIPTRKTPVPARSTSPTEDEIAAAFTEAWIKCMTEHTATLISGPCDRCAAEAGERLREAGAA